jgi:monoterpene epsilon-lactone hydrolase
MPSQAMRDSIEAIRDRSKASASRAPATLDERRATFIPGDRLHPVPDDVLVTEVAAGGVPAHWLAAPGADSGRVLLFLHGGGYELGSVRSDGELAARLGRAGGMRVLFLEYRLAPEHPFPAAIDDVLAAWRWLRTDQGLSAPSIPAAAVLMSPTVDLTTPLAGVAAVRLADRAPAAAYPGRHGRPAAQRFRTPGRGGSRSGGRREVPAGPGPPTRQSR